MSAIDEHPSRPRRADARRNRERVLAAAAELFAEEGCKVQIEQVAHRAGVGVGTVCRNFPTKVDLVDAVVTQGCELLLEDARTALDEPDAGAALRRFFVRMADFQTRHRALAEEMSAAIPASTVSVKQALHEAVGDLMSKAQAAGAILEQQDGLIRHTWRLRGIGIGNCANQRLNGRRLLTSSRLLRARRLR